MTELQRIMHVEDDPSIQQVAKIALEAVGGFTVHTCSSGQQALDDYQAFTPQLILMDVMMPGMDGPETFRALRGMPETRKIPVVFMTAKVQAAEVESYRAMGAVAVIPKPFDPMALGDKVREIWNSL